MRVLRLAPYVVLIAASLLAAGAVAVTMDRVWSQLGPWAWPSLAVVAGSVWRVLASSD